MQSSSPDSATPRPRNWIEVRFEDFVQCRDETLAPPGVLPGSQAGPDSRERRGGGRWKHDPGHNHYDLLAPALERYVWDVSVGGLTARLRQAAATVGHGAVATYL